ncbi:ATP-binding protein [Halomonadaceae bacterium KBTZ08]
MKQPPWPTDEQQRQSALDQTCLASSVPDERLDRITEIATYSLGVPIALVTLIDGDRQRFKSSQGLDMAETGRNVSFCGHAVYRDMPLVVNDVAQDHRFADNPLVTGPPYIGFYAGIPIHDDQGHALGTLCVMDTGPRQLDNGQYRCLSHLAQTVESVIQQDQVQRRSVAEAQKHREDELQRHNRALGLLNEIAFDMQGPLDEQVQRALSLGLEFLELDIAIVSDIVGELYTVKWCKAPVGVELYPGREFRLGDTYCDLVMSHDREVAIHHMGQSDERAHPCYGMFQLEAYIGARLEDEQGAVGTINFSSPWPRQPFGQSERLFVRLLSRWISNKLAYHRRQHRLEKLLRQLPGAVYQFRQWPSGEAVFPFMSNGLEKLYGIDPQTAMADAGAVLDKTHPEDKPAVAQTTDESFTHLTPWHLEFRVQGGDGHYHWIKGASVPEKLQDGSVLWHGYLDDINARKQAELALESSEARLRGLFDFSPVGIALNDLATGYFLEMNNALLAATGYTWQEFMALTYHQLTPAEYEPAEREALEHLCTTGRYGPFEKEYIRKDGSRYPVRLHGMLVTDSDGRALIWSLIEDITERKQIENMKNQFIATVSHELRTPLTSILGALKLVNGGAVGAIPAKAERLLQRAQSNGERLAELIGDLLDMEKIVSGKLTVTLESQPLTPIIQEAVESLWEVGGERGVTIDYVQPEDEIVARVDRQRLIQAVTNLLSNAIKFSPDDTSVIVACSKGSGHVRIDVEDKGPGVSPSFESMLFDRFAQADASDKKKPGTGLGLTITRELMHQMHGEVTYQSGSGGGSTFTLTLPLSGGDD